MEQKREVKPEDGGEGGREEEVVDNELCEEEREGKCLTLRVVVVDV